MVLWYELFVRELLLDDGCEGSGRTDGVLIDGDLLAFVVLLGDECVVPDEVRSVPGDVVSWSQGRRVDDGLVVALRVVTDGRQTSPRSHARTAFHLATTTDTQTELTKPVVLAILLRPL